VNGWYPYSPGKFLQSQIKIRRINAYQHIWWVLPKSIFKCFFQAQQAGQMTYYFEQPHNSELLVIGPRIATSAAHLRPGNSFKLSIRKSLPQRLD
jgi:hypothetical protein